MFMLEALPLLGGAGIGWALFRSRLGLRGRVGALAAASIPIGLSVAALAGELADSPAYVVWDAAQVAAAGAVTLLVLARMAVRARRLG